MGKSIKPDTYASNLKRYIFAPDIHFGYEFDEDWGKFVTSHDSGLVTKMVRAALDFKPQYFILGGDQINLSCISRWTRGKPLMIEGRRIEEDYELLFDLLVKPLRKLTDLTLIWLEGNHEERLRKIALEYPQLSGLLTHEKVLASLGYSPQVFEYYKAGKLYAPINCKRYFTHGHTHTTGANPAKTLVTSYHRSVAAGHYHRYSVWTENVAADATDYHTGVIVPASCRPNLPYAKSRPSSNQQGFMAGYFDPQTGYFWDDVVKVVDGKFILNGKVY
jgi:hypothetical protein